MKDDNALKTRESLLVIEEQCNEAIFSSWPPKPLSSTFVPYEMVKGQLMASVASIYHVIKSQPSEVRNNIQCVLKKP